MPTPTPTPGVGGDGDVGVPRPRETREEGKAETIFQLTVDGGTAR